MITARLALVLQIFRWACGEVHKDFVDIDSTKSAIALSEYFESCYSDIQKYMLRESIEPQKKNYLIAFLNSLQLPMQFKQGKKSDYQKGL